jgi:HD-like signal output (HDOD) protein/CRP-like cAMP-binding protein
MRKQVAPALSSRLVDLDERDLRNLYSLSKVHRLQPGDTLVEEGHKDQTIYLLLEGELKMVMTRQDIVQEVSRVRQDRGAGGVVFLNPEPWPVSLVTAAPVTVLAVKNTIFDTLSDAIKLYFFKRVHRFDLAFVTELLGDNVQLSDRADRYQNYIYSQEQKYRRDYSKSELINGILKRIPKLPVFASTLAFDLMDEEVSSNDVSEKVKQDPSLAANVLKMVNSSYYGFDKKISDINHAVILMGFNDLYQMVIEEGVRRAMPNSANFQNILSHSICISRIAFALALETHAGKPAELSTIGLLHDLGVSVKHLLKKQNPKLDMLIEYLDTSAIGSLLLNRWNLPEKVWQSIEYQNYPGFAAPARIPEMYRNNSAILYLAHLCYDNIWGEMDTNVPSPFLQDYLTMLGIGNQSVRDITRKKVMPFLMRNINSFPAFFRKHLKGKRASSSALMAA